MGTHAGALILAGPYLSLNLGEGHCDNSPSKSLSLCMEQALREVWLSVWADSSRETFLPPWETQVAPI